MSAHEDEHSLIEDIIAEFRDDPAFRMGQRRSSVAPEIPKEDDLEALLASVRAMTAEIPEQEPELWEEVPTEEAASEEKPQEIKREAPSLAPAPSISPEESQAEPEKIVPEESPAETPPATLEERLRARNIQVETMDFSAPSTLAPKRSEPKQAAPPAKAPEVPKESPQESEPELLYTGDRPRKKKNPLLMFPQKPEEPEVIAETPEEPAAVQEDHFTEDEPVLPEKKSKKRRPPPQKKRHFPESEPEESVDEVAWEAPESEFDREGFDPEQVVKKHIPYDLFNRPCDDPAQMSQKLRKRLGSIAARLLLTILPAAASIYMTGAVYQGWVMPIGFTWDAFQGEYALVLAGLLVLSMVLCYETVLSGLWRLLKRRPTLDSIVAVSCLICITDCILPYFQPQWRQGVPCACVCIVTCFFAQMSKWQRYEALRRNYKSVAMGASPMSLKLYSDGNVQDMAIKTQSGVNIEPEELAEYDFTERFSCYYSPIILVLAAALAFSASIGKGEVHRLLWSFSCILSVAAPMCLLLSSSAGAKSLGKKLYTSGSLLINASKAGKLARCRSAVLRDADLFPAGTVSITGMKAADRQSVEELLGCTASLLQEVGGGLGKCFVDFARQQYIVPNKARELRFFDTRGICATVSGRYVQVGTANYLTRSGIQIDFGQKVKNNIFIAINSQFAGVFSLRYKAQPAVYSAFGLLKQCHVRPVLALRDMFQTQNQIESLFELRRNSTYQPGLEARLDYSDNAFGRDEETLALLFRDGLMPLSETISAAKKWKRSARWGCTLGTICALCGMMIMTFLAGKGAFSSADPCNILLYLLLWSLPVKLIRGMITKN